MLLIVNRKFFLLRKWNVLQIEFLFQCFMIKCLKKTMSEFTMYSHCRPKNFISLLIFYIFICGNLRHLRIYLFCGLLPLAQGVAQSVAQEVE